MQEQKKPKQSIFEFGQITISSKFESGNLQNVHMISETQFNLWISSDPNANYKTWFYFSIQGISQSSTVSFTIMNMNNQVKLYKEGLLPVFKVEGAKEWSRIRIPIQANGVVKGETGFQVSFRHTFVEEGKHYFAFTYPWTTQENDQFIEKLIDKNYGSLFCKYQSLCTSFQGRSVNLLTLTKAKKGQQLKFQTLDNSKIIIFPQRKGIFISARVHPGETASSHTMNGILEQLFSNSQLSRNLLESCVFYLLPIINPDGVAEGCFRTDSQGKNLNRYYTAPLPESQPEIFWIKKFLVDMIKDKKIIFCLDLHAHVNKQGAFMYGNSSNNLYNQMRVCLFPKLMSFNSEIFDFDSCNCSEKNMSSKDKGDQLSKEGASRVAIFKETNLVQCWTLECNYNSAKFYHQLLQPVGETKNSLSHSVLSSRIQPDFIQQVKYLDIPDFQKLGKAIVQSLADFYHLKQVCRIYSTKLKNQSNLQLNMAICSLRLIPFRFDTQCRKILDNLNSSLNIRSCMDRLSCILSARGNKISNMNHKISISINNTINSGNTINSNNSINKNIMNINMINVTSVNSVNSVNSYGSSNNMMVGKIQSNSVNSSKIVAISQSASRSKRDSCRRRININYQKDKEEVGRSGSRKDGLIRSWRKIQDKDRDGDRQRKYEGIDKILKTQTRINKIPNIPKSKN